MPKPKSEIFGPVAKSPTLMVNSSSGKPATMPHKLEPGSSETAQPILQKRRYPIIAPFVPSKRKNTHVPTEKDRVFAESWSEFQQLMNITNEIIACNDEEDCIDEMLSSPWAQQIYELYNQTHEARRRKEELQEKRVDLHAQWPVIASALQTQGSYPVYDQAAMIYAKAGNRGRQVSNKKPSI